MAENKYCYNCCKYKPYYTKGNKQFDKCDIGYCREERRTVDKHFTCKYFSNKQYLRIDRKQSALKALTEHINALSEIKQILEEDDEEVLDKFLLNFKEIKKRSSD